jgi:alkylation response protein AidB-like acyl-CoA dehydrogenase
MIIFDEPAMPSPLFHIMPLFAMNHGSHALGIARAALECAKEIAIEKMAYGNKTTIAGERRTQLLVADAAVTIAAARTYLYDLCQAAWDLACDGPTDTLTRSRARLATGHAAKSSVRAVDMLHEALGTASVFAKNPIERQFRDLHTAGAHVMIGTLVYEAAGRAELGLEPDFAFF